MRNFLQNHLLKMEGHFLITYKANTYCTDVFLKTEQREGG